MSRTLRSHARSALPSAMAAGPLPRAEVFGQTSGANASSTCPPMCERFDAALRSWPVSTVNDPLTSHLEHARVGVLGVLVEPTLGVQEARDALHRVLHQGGAALPFAVVVDELGMRRAVPGRGQRRHLAADRLQRRLDVARGGADLAGR